MNKEFELNNDQILILNKIFYKRRNLIVGVFGGLPVFIASARGYAIIKSNEILIIDVVYLFLTIFILLILLILYIKKVSVIKKDIKNKSGEYQSHQIVNKTYFEHVGKFYLFFDDINFPSIEVDYEKYNCYEIGNEYLVTVSKYSKLVLDDFMNYKLF